MKVEVVRSWTHPVEGRTYPNGTKLEIDPKWFNPAFLKEVKKVKTKKVK